MTIKLLALDYGQKRVGVAVCQIEVDTANQDPLIEAFAPGALAFPRPALLRTTRQEFFQRLLALIEQEAPAALVLGLPLCADGSDSLTTRQVRNFAASLARRTPLPIYFMDETLSSAEAESLLRHSGPGRRRGEGVIDSQAAVGILQSFLNLAPQRRRGQKYSGEPAGLAAGL